MDINNEVGSQGNEQGLLGLVFHPYYSSTGLFFVNYTDVNGNTVIARFHVSADDPNRADPASEVDLLNVDQPYTNHNGGGLAFGPDGDLYIGLGTVVRVAIHWRTVRTYGPCLANRCASTWIKSSCMPSQPITSIPEVEGYQKSGLMSAQSLAFLL